MFATMANGLMRDGPLGAVEELWGVGGVGGVDGA